MMDGLYFATSGEVRAFGRLLTEEAFQDAAFNFSFRRRVGLVFQDSDVQLFSPSVWDEVAFAPLQLGLSRDEVIARVDVALAHCASKSCATARRIGCRVEKRSGWRSPQCSVSIQTCG